MRERTAEDIEYQRIHTAFGQNHSLLGENRWQVSLQSIRSHLCHDVELTYRFELPLVLQDWHFGQQTAKTFCVYLGEDDQLWPALLWCHSQELRILGENADFSGKQQSPLPNVEDPRKLINQKVMDMEGLLFCFVIRQPWDTKWIDYYSQSLDKKSKIRPRYLDILELA